MAQGAIMPVSAPVSKRAEPSFQFDWKQVESGLPLGTLDAFAAYSGLAVKELQEVVIPLRTLKHRRQRQQSLSLEESDRLGRIVRTFELAVRVYGDNENASDCLTTPTHRFDGRTPLSMLRTGAGELAVQEFLIQIDEGYFA
jgi:putative toxin-antitoxin system antitoxin component (TIGR02293 family)